MELLWIDDDKNFLFGMQNNLAPKHRLTTADGIQSALQQLAARTFDLVLVDLDIGGESGLDALALLHQHDAALDVVMVSGHKDPKQIVAALHAGAVDYIAKPFAPEELDALLTKREQVQTLRARHDALLADLSTAHPHRAFIGASASFRAMLSSADRLRGHGANVLLIGESGTGKELLARYLHGLEHDVKRPFIAVNCAAIPEGLLESELFGHERGAFTGATQRKLGKFELAAGGDIFLDEIGTLRQELQAKILRVLQEKEFMRVGGTTAIHVAFRVIAATNEPLERAVQLGNFRMDLYHRLRVIQLTIPPLRERIEDIPLLISHFLDKYSKVSTRKHITAAALRRLQAYAWPGNIRELENIIHSLIILSPDEVIDENDLPSWAFPLAGALTPSTSTQSTAVPFLEESGDNLPRLKEYVRNAERCYISHVLTQNRGDKSATANTLDVGRTTLYAKLRELNLE